MFDNYLLLNTKSIDNLVESFLSAYMVKIVEELTSEKYNRLTKQLLDGLIKKPTWTQDVNRNWNEILIGKQRFDLKEQQKSVLMKKNVRFHFIYLILVKLIAKL